MAGIEPLCTNNHLTEAEAKWWNLGKHHLFFVCYPSASVMDTGKAIKIKGCLKRAAFFFNNPYQFNSCIFSLQLSYSYSQFQANILPVASVPDSCHASVLCVLLSGA